MTSVQCLKLVKDKNGNSLQMLENGDVILALKSEKGRVRHIGRMIGGIGGIYAKKEGRDGIFQTFKAFGFCEAIFKCFDPRSVIILYHNKHYYINRARFDKNKMYMHFKQKGLELRTYIPVKFFKRKRNGL